MTVIFHGSVQNYTSGEKSVEVEGDLDLRSLVGLLGERIGGGLADFLLGDKTCLFLPPVVATVMIRLLLKSGSELPIWEEMVFGSAGAVHRNSSGYNKHAEGINAHIHLIFKAFTVRLR